MTTHPLPIEPTREQDALTRHQSPHASSGSRRYFNPCCRVRVTTTSGSSWGEHEIEGGTFGHWLLQGHHGSRQQQQQPPPPKPHATASPDLQHSLPQSPSSCTSAVLVLSSSTGSKRSKRSKPWWKMRVPHGDRTASVVATGMSDKITLTEQEHEKQGTNLEHKSWNPETTCSSSK